MVCFQYTLSFFKISQKNVFATALGILVGGGSNGKGLQSIIDKVLNNLVVINQALIT